MSAATEPPEEARHLAARAEELARQVADCAVTVRTPNRELTLTVAPGGVLRDLTLAEAANALDGRQLARLIVASYRAAAAAAAARLSDQPAAIAWLTTPPATEPPPEAAPGPPPHATATPRQSAAPEAPRPAVTDQSATQGPGASRKPAPQSRPPADKAPDHPTLHHLRTQAAAHLAAATALRATLAQTTTHLTSDDAAITVTVRAGHLTALTIRDDADRAAILPLIRAALARSAQRATRAVADVVDFPLGAENAR